MLETSLFLLILLIAFNPTNIIIYLPLLFAALVFMAYQNLKEIQ